MSVFEVIPAHIFPAFSRIRIEYEEIRSISLYSVRIQENAGKNADQNNSEYVHFLRSVTVENKINHHLQFLTDCLGQTKEI